MCLNEGEVNGIKSLVDAGSKITGSAVGAGIGFLLGGPIGAAMGGGSAYMLQRGIIEVGTDIAERLLSEREKIRIGGVTIYAVDKILKKLAAGEMLRDDGFFESLSTGHPACAEIPIIERPPANEVFEGILLAVQREHEENKLPFVGNLLANIFFDSIIDKAQANLLIKFAQRFSFRQMCILSLYADQDKIIEMKRRCINNPQEYSIAKRESLLSEAVELGLLFRGRDLSFDSMPGIPVSSLYDLWHSENVQVAGVGRDLYRLMELERIDDGELVAIVSLIFNANFENYDIAH